MPRLPATVLACLALAACGLVAGCGDDNKDTSSTPATPPAAAPPPAAAAAAGDVVKVTMKDIKFVPADITAKVGQKIEWTNTDTPAHNVTAKDGADFASDTLNPGDTFDYTPTKAGKIDYVCTIHPGQSGTITVTK